MLILLIQGGIQDLGKPADVILERSLSRFESKPINLLSEVVAAVL